MAHFKGCLFNGGKSRCRFRRNATKGAGITAMVLNPWFGGKVHIWHDHDTHEDRVTFSLFKLGGREKFNAITYTMDEKGNIHER